MPIDNFPPPFLEHFPLVLQRYFHSSDDKLKQKQVVSCQFYQLSVELSVWFLTRLLSGNLSVDSLTDWLSDWLKIEPKI